MENDRGNKDTWSVFRIMGEFVEGFETLRGVWPAVSVFGGSRVRKSHPSYKNTVKLTERLANAGYSVITGGGPGIMEAANRGSAKGDAQSIGLNIRLPSKQPANEYAETIVDFNYFFARKVMFVKYSCAIVGMPGGFGTLDEIFEALTLVQTEKIDDLPVVLFGSEFWGGMVRWLEQAPLAEGLLRKRDMELFHVTDDPDETMEIIQSHLQHLMKRMGPGMVGRDTP